MHTWTVFPYSYLVFSGVAIWVARGGQSATPDSENFAKNREKEGKNREKEEKSGRKGKKSGSFFHFAPPPTDRPGYVTSCLLNVSVSAIARHHTPKMDLSVIFSTPKSGKIIA